MTVDQPLDPRVHAYRPDLAASSLRGRVNAERFVDGVVCQVRSGFVSLKEQPGFEARQASELLFGETVTVFEERNGWVWCQNDTDGYVGWMRLEGLDTDVHRPTHRVTALRSFLYGEPDLKTPFADILSLGARVAVIGEQGNWCEIAGGGWLYARHLQPLDGEPADPVVTAERFLGTPYLWGGRTSIGIDCSGLVQMALSSAGIACPRDSDQQQAAIGALVSGTGEGHAFQRGDIVFFPGHVGIMADGVDLIHANAFHMAVVREPLAAVLERAGRGGAITAIRRL